MRRRHRHVPALLLPLVVAAMACDSPRLSSTVSQRDSGGVRIVESRAPAWSGERAWRLASTPTLSIGARYSGAEYRFDQPYSATRLSDGRVVVANWGTRELRWFDAAGQHLHSAGKAGTAPGEFTYLSWITRTRGDSILVTDAGRALLTVFTPDGAVGRTTELPPFPGIARFTGSVAEGGVLLTVSTRGRIGVPTALARDTFVLIHHDPALPRTDTIGGFPGAWTYRQVLETGGIAAWSPPLRGHTTVATGGGRIYVADPDRDQVLVYEPTGRLRAIFRRLREPRRVGEDEISRFREHVQASAADEEQRRARAEAYELIPFPPTLPAFESIAADARGRVWIQEYALPWESGPQRWSVIDASGTWLGTVEIPQRLVVLEIGEDYVLGVSREEGVDVIRVFELMR